MLRRLVMILLIVPLFSFGNSIEQSYLNEMVQLYKRPITFLALGSDCFAMIQTLSKEHEGGFVFIDHTSTPPSHLPTNCIHLNVKCETETLTHLGESEHFDLVFVKDHNQPLDRDYAQALYDLGENVIVHLQREKRALIPHLLSLNFNYVKPELYHAHHQITFLKRTHWLEMASDANCVRHIHSNYKEKILYKNFDNQSTASVWLPGINLMTFKMLSGSFPHTDHLQKEIERLYYIPHLDWMPNNIIVQGTNLEFIDFDDPSNSEPKTVHSQEMLNLMHSFVVETDPSNIPRIYNEILIYNRLQIHPICMRLEAASLK